VSKRGAGPSRCGTVVLVQESAQSVAAFDRAFAVVVLDEVAKYAVEVASPCDQEPVEALLAHAANEAFRVRVRLCRPDGVRMTRIPWLRNTSSNEALNLRSWGRLGAGPRPARASTRRTVLADTEKPSFSSSPAIR
jgi:hypothetical protein